MLIDRNSGILDQVLQCSNISNKYTLNLQVNVELLGNTTEGMMNMEQNLWQQNVGTPPAVPETVTVTLTQSPGEGQ